MTSNTLERRTPLQRGTKWIGAIDPGPTQSALIVWDGQCVVTALQAANETIREYLFGLREEGSALYIEKIASYGMAVGAEVFETVYWSGRFAEVWYREGDEVVRIPRLKVKTHLCHDSRAKDANIRQALIDRLGPAGTKKDPGPTYGISKDLWAALALAVTAWDIHHGEAE